MGSGKGKYTFMKQGEQDWDNIKKINCTVTTKIPDKIELDGVVFFLQRKKHHLFILYTIAIILRIVDPFLYKSFDDQVVHKLLP
jgi:hypothetical protein